MELIYHDMNKEIQIKSECATEDGIEKYNDYYLLGVSLFDYIEVDFNSILADLKRYIDMAPSMLNKDTKHVIDEISNFKSLKIDKCPYLFHHFNKANALSHLYDIFLLFETGGKEFDVNIEDLNTEYENSSNMLMSAFEKIRDTADKYKSAIDYCLNPEGPYRELKLTPIQKFALFDVLFPSYVGNLTLNVKYTSDPSHKLANSHIFDFFSDDLTMTQREVREYIRDYELHLYEIYEVDIEQACYLEFFKLLEENRPVRKCKHCGKFFIPRSRSDEVYCDRLQDNNKTCKQIGGAYLDNPGYREYRTIYQVFRQLMKRNSEQFDWLEGAFDDWYGEAKIKRKNLTDNPQDIEEFKEWLDTSYSEIKKRIRGEKGIE